MTEYDKEIATKQANAEWERNPSLRQEFNGKRDSYVAYTLATRRGLARIQGAEPKRA